MKFIFATSVCIVLFPGVMLAQKKPANRLPFEDNTLQNSKQFTIMPYNRLIKSAGKVIAYGDSTLENHTLDVSVLPDKKNIVIEDRYGIAVLNIKSNKIIARWSFVQDKNWNYLISTYSGITSFTYKNKVFIAWGASGSGNRSAIMITSWDGFNISNVTGISIDAISPASVALPNQVIGNIEDGKLYLYVVLNGNNQLLKIDFDSKKIVYAVPTGVAPYGLCIVGNKAYVTNWAGPVVTDTIPEHAGTPWGGAYTDPVTGATNPGSLSIINNATGKPENELQLGLHPSAIIKSADDKYVYITNGNSDYVSVIDVLKEQNIDSIYTGLFEQRYHYYGSSPGALLIDSGTGTLYVANGMDNAVAVIKLGKNGFSGSKGSTKITGYIPTAAYPSGIEMVNQKLYITNLEASGSRVLSKTLEFKSSSGQPLKAYTIHREIASL
ncbi:MAG: phosphoesterase, partial [Ginsengibacter sp.]